MVQFIEISYKSFEYSFIHSASQQIIELLPLNWKFSHYSLPIKMKKFTVLSSPHIDKKSREQFQMKYYKNKIIFFPTSCQKSHQQVTLFIENMKHIPFSGVQVQVQISYESFL